MSLRLREAVRSALSKIGANAEETVRRRSVAPENIELLRAAGFFRAFQPKAYGGMESSFSEYAECVIEIAKHCASTAWASALLANHSHALALFSRSLQDLIWASTPDAIASSSVAPLGRWEPAQGGILLSGKFGWSSGCEHADWAILGFKGTNNVGQPGPCFAVVPRSSYTILDTWDSAALVGTGSHTIELNNVFVPDEHIESLFALNFGLARGFGHHSGAIFNAPFSPVFSLGFAAVALGIAYRFVDVFIEKTKNRIRAYNSANVSHSTSAQMRLGESVNQIQAAHALLVRDWSDMDARAQSGSLPSMDDIMSWRSRQAYAIKMSIEAVDRLFAASGGAAWLNTNEMQRLFRDIHVAGSHAQTDYDVAAETYGKYLLEQPMGNSY
jgi:alkylation response protein AidB-like acyl-CoA dehydrogenase